MDGDHLPQAPPLLPGVEDPGHKGHLLGTHRTCAPSETIARIQALRRVFGITRVADLTGLDTLGVPVVSVYRPNSRSISTAHGKGVSIEAAKASGLMEAVEAYHAERIDLPLWLSSYEELSLNRACVDPLALPRTHTSLYQPRRRLLWIEGWDLLERETVCLPHECVHVDFRVPLPSGSGAFLLSSNGLASGNHLFEAVSHGICEVVERDANALWHLVPEALRWRRRRVALERVEDHCCRSVLDRFAAASVSCGAWEITTDIGIPTFAAAIVDAEHDPIAVQYVTCGLGSHACPRVALLRALTEAAQCRLTYISGARDDSDRDIYERASNREVVALARRRLAEPPLDTIELDACEDYAGPRFRDDVEWALGRLHAAGIRRVVVVNLSKPGLDIPVVRVVIPGLEGIHDVPDYRPGARAQRRWQELNS